MLKVLIVDDEMLVKIGMHNAIPWEEHGFVIIGEASNGKQALEIARKEHPDVVFTDIRMPIMDGIQLIETLRAEQPGVRFVILSAYRDAYYVQQAASMGVTEYVLKLSMGEEELIQVLKRIRRQIEDERQMEALVGMRREIEQCSLFMCSPDHLEPGFTLPPWPIRVVVCLPCVPIADATPLQVAQKLRGALKGEGVAFFLEGERYGLLVSDPRSEPGWAETLRSAAERRTGQALRLGVSRPVLERDALPDALHQAETAARHAFYARDAQALFAEALPPYLPAAEHPKWRSLERSMNAGQLAMACKQAEELLTQSQEQLIAPESAIRIIEDLIHQLDTDLSVPDRFETLDALRSAALPVLEDYQQERKKTYGPDMLAILDYVHCNYRRMIRLSDVARLIYRNETYVSYLFRKKMNIRFVDYVTNVRVEEACELLRQTDQPIATIAEQVGFGDPAYFCRVFKKNMGVSPHAFRNSNRSVDLH